MSCSWTITPAIGVASQVIIIYFAAGFSTEASYDTVNVYSGTSALTANRVSLLSGSYPSGATVTVSGSSAYVTFASDGSVTSTGFSATYQVIGQYCIGFLPLTSASGTISSGSASTYINNMNCTWSIAPSPVAVFMSFTLTRLSTQLNTDVVKLYTGTNSTGSLIATYSGSTLPATVVLKTPAIFVQWTSDASIVNTGFSASYVSNLLSSYCSGSTVYTGRTGSLSSGPSPYFENMACTWLISISGVMRIMITFSDFNTASSDLVRIYSGPNSLSPLEASCSGTTCSNVTVISATAFVSWASSANSTQVTGGWTASYRSDLVSQFCSGAATLTDAAGSITPAPPPYLNNMTCSWTVMPPSVASFYLYFTSVDLAAGDSLVVFNALGAVVASYSSAAPPPLFTTLAFSGPSFRLNWTSDAANVGDGFTVIYTTTSFSPCSGASVLSTASGFYGTGNIYGSNLCSWTVAPVPTSAMIVVTFLNFPTSSTGSQTYYVYTADGAYAGSASPSSAAAITVYGQSFNSEWTFAAPSSLSLATGFSAYYYSVPLASSANLFATFGNSYGQGLPCSSSSGASITGVSGALRSGSGNYATGLTCRWVIQSTAQTTRINLSFVTFSTASTDRVTIYDMNGEVKASYSGSTLPSELAVAGNSSVIVYTSSSASAVTSSYAGWSFLWSSCDGSSCSSYPEYPTSWQTPTSWLVPVIAGVCGGVVGLIIITVVIVCAVKRCQGAKRPPPKTARPPQSIQMNTITSPQTYNYPSAPPQVPTGYPIQQPTAQINAAPPPPQYATHYSQSHYPQAYGSSPPPPVGPDYSMPVANYGFAPPPPQWDSNTPAVSQYPPAMLLPQQHQYGTGFVPPPPQVPTQYGAYPDAPQSPNVAYPSAPPPQPPPQAYGALPYGMSGPDGQQY
eukprot:TRINITY_DN4295_c0_g3_i5.p1 TRINITY_DN4295_c0_g3~~TRINITY_DN4295_c0_g3_i5.p1  ORF type:complete len:907 (-),score=170.93 TRINITY_DN4295_c0_g3_i5:1442-4162(-)